MWNVQRNAAVIAVTFAYERWCHSSIVSGISLLSIIREWIIPSFESLPELRKKYPDNPSFMFLDAMLDENHERAIKKYKKIYNLYEDSKYADDAIMKISEFYYGSI